MELPAVVCDTGTGVIKAGFAGEKAPSVEFQTLLGRPMLQANEGLTGVQLSDLMVGDAANNARSVCRLSRPIENGVIQDWQGMEAIWDHTFEKMGCNTSERRVVQTEAALNPLKNREQIVELMFEKYSFQAVNVSVQAILALCSRGLDTGFVVDSGDGVTHLVPVLKSFVEPAYVERINIAGRHVTEQLMKLLLANGKSLNSTTDFETVREVKQKHCYVAYDLQAERRLANETTVVDRKFTLPDTREIRLSSERFLAPEILFSPQLFDRSRDDHQGLARKVYDTINKNSIDARKELFQSIVLSGGTTTFPGFSSRLEKDIKQLHADATARGSQQSSTKFRCTVEDPPERQHMVFNGASLLGAFHQADSPWWMTRAEYNELGASAVHRLVTTRLR